MTINAKEKIIKMVDELLPMDNTIPCEHYRNERAIELFYKFSYFFNIKELLRKYKHQYLQYAIDSYTYPNGLIRLESYCVLSGEYVINQTIITDSLEGNNAIVHVWNKYELKSLPQFFIKSESANSIFGIPGSEERSIETNETEIEIDNMVIGRFLIISKNKSSTVYAEKYMPINRFTDWNLNLKDIFSDVELEILYRYKDKPAFAQLLDDQGKNLLEGTQYNSNNHEDAKILINSVNNEVDVIIEEIATIIFEYGKKNKENENNSDKNNWIEEINKIHSRLTREKSAELIDAREDYIQQKMREIEEREYESEVLQMLEDENYDEEYFNMILGPGYPTNSSNKNDGQKKKLVKKKDDDESKTSK